jgi:hypothetical protein
MSSATSANSVQLLAEALSGPVLVPGGPGYDEARRIHNGLIDNSRGDRAMSAHCGRPACGYFRPERRA